MRATTGAPNCPGRTSAALTSPATQSSVSSLGKLNSGGITPITWRISPAMKYVFPTTAGSRPNQVLQSRSLMTATRSPSSGTGSRPACGRAPSVA